MKLSDLLAEPLISVQLAASTQLGVLEELSELLARHHEGVDAGRVARALMERERIMSTAVGHGVAIPHAKTPAVPAVMACLGIHRQGMDFGAEDQERTHLFFTLLAPEESVGEHLKVLARISRLCQDPPFRAALQAADTPATALGVILEAEKAL